MPADAAPRPPGQVPRVRLLCAQPARADDVPVRRGPLARLAVRARRRLDRLRWAAGGIPAFDARIYQDHSGSDRATIAAREAVVALLQAAFAAARIETAGWHDPPNLDGGLAPADLTLCLGEPGPATWRDPVVRLALPADPLLFLPPAPPVTPPPDPMPGTLTIGLHIAFDDQPLAPRLLRAAAVARALARRRACRFVCFVQSDAERLIPDLLRRVGVAVTVADLPAAQQLAWYARLDLHLCQTAAAAALACNAGIPPVCAGDAAVVAFGAAMGLEATCLAAADATVARLGVVIDDTLRDRAALARHIARRTAALRLRTEAYLASLAAAAPGAG